MPPAPDSIPASARRLRRLSQMVNLYLLIWALIFLAILILFDPSPTSILSRMGSTILPSILIAWSLGGLADWLILRQRVGESPRLVLVGASHTPDHLPPILTMTQVRVALGLYCLLLAGAVAAIAIALVQRFAVVPYVLAALGYTLYMYLSAWAKQWRP